MLITSGRVNGNLVEIEGEDLPEGARVTIIVRENGETFEATHDEESKLLAAITEAERGEVTDASDVLRQISRP